MDHLIIEYTLWLKSTTTKASSTTKRMSSLSKVHIFVPTRGRHATRRTIKNLCLEDMAAEYTIKVLIPENEKEAWEGTTSLDLVTVPNEWRIEQIRQHIVDTYQEFPLHIVIDDDLRFCLRKDDGFTPLTKPSEVRTFFEHLISLLGEYKHGGIANQTIHPHTPGIYFNERVGGLYYYHSTMLRDLDFTACPEYEDMHVSLSLIEQGHACVVSHHYMFSQTTNSKGGCSTYRTLESQNANALVFQSHHPKYVKLRKERYSKLWKGMKIGVIVSWKKAFADTQDDKPKPKKRKKLKE